MSQAVLTETSLLRRLVKSCFRIILILVLIVLVLLGIVWCLAGTDRGFDWALSQASKRVDGLEITIV